MPHVVDPRPLARERRAAIDAEHRPRIAQLERSVAALRRELRVARRAYRRARREARGWPAVS